MYYGLLAVGVGLGCLWFVIGGGYNSNHRFIVDCNNNGIDFWSQVRHCYRTSAAGLSTHNRNMEY